MEERIKKWLIDIQLAISEIDDYFQHYNKDFHEYQKNKILKRAIERNLEIIGEAINRIIKSAPAYEQKIQSAKGIIGLRNIIIHAYDNVSDENIWAIIINHLPKLKEDVNKLLEERD